MGSTALPMSPPIARSSIPTPLRLPAEPATGLQSLLTSDSESEAPAHAWLLVSGWGLTTRQQQHMTTHRPVLSRLTGDSDSSIGLEPFTSLTRPHHIADLR